MILVLLRVKKTNHMHPNFRAMNQLEDIDVGTIVVAVVVAVAVVAVAAMDIGAVVEQMAEDGFQTHYNPNRFDAPVETIDEVEYCLRDGWSKFLEKIGDYPGVFQIVGDLYIVSSVNLAY